MFKGPVDQSLPWSEDGPKAARKFLDRFYRLFSEKEYVDKWTDGENPALDVVYNQTVKKCTGDYEILHFNTGISQIMICVNEFLKADSLPKSMLQGLCQLLAPIAPHMAQECYSLLGNDGLIDFVPWPSYDDSKLNAQPVTYAVQVNGKLRGTISYKKDASDEELEELKKQAVAVDTVIPFLKDKEIVKVIVVKNKIVSIVVR